MWVTVDGKDIVPPPYEPHVRVCRGCAEKARFENSDDFKGTKGAHTVFIPPDITEYDEDQLTTEPSRAEVMTYG